MSWFIMTKIHKYIITVLWCKYQFWSVITDLQTGFSEWVRCSQAFLFSIVNPHGLGPTKMPLFQRHGHSIYCKASHGPSFGGGHDLHISGNANNNASSYAYLGGSYQCPTGQNARTFLAGVKNFTVTDYEVFELHIWQTKYSFPRQRPQG